MKKIGIITSKGGHLLEISQLIPLFSKYRHFWVSFKGKDVLHLKNRGKIYYANYPETRHAINFIKNLYLASRVFAIEKPTTLISCGAGIALPFFVIGKLFFKTRIMYIESFDCIAYPSLTGRLVYNLADLFLVQHKEQKKWYPKAKYWGSLL